MYFRRYDDVLCFHDDDCIVMIFIAESAERTFDRYSDFCMKEGIPDALRSLDVEIKNLLSRCFSPTVDWEMTVR